MRTLLRAFASLALAALACSARGETTVAGFTPGSFRVTESGAAAYSIPIQVPPGIAGMQPDIAIGYNSQGSGGGLLGTGWGLSGLSVIHRCARTLVQDGINTGITYTASDRYCLDGQRLVAVSGSYGANGTEYRTERESFSKIVSYGTAGNGPASFKVWTKSGQVLEFGNTADSQIEAQGKSSVRLWAINKVSDTAGNTMTFVYEEDNTNGDSRPSRIVYTGNGSAAPFARVEFVYEDRISTDIGSFYVAGSKISVQKRLIRIRTYLGASPGSGTLVRDYRLAYELPPDPNPPTYQGPSRLTSITECDGTTSSANCYPPIVPSWNNPGGLVGFGTSTWNNLGNLRGVTGDVTGDGLADLVTVACTPWNEAAAASCTVGLMLNTGTGFTASSWGGCSFNPLTSYIAVSLGDVNGDGRADLLACGQLRYSTGSSFGSPVASPGYGLLADVNGDGLADLLATTCMAGSEAGAGNCDVALSLSNGSTFGSVVWSGSGAWTGAYYLNGEWAGAPNPVAAGDVNGDGRADLLLGGALRFSNGSGFDAAASTPGYGLLADANGDGLADLLPVSCTLSEAGGTCSIGLSLSNGSENFGMTLWAGTSAAVFHGMEFSISFGTGDVNGDGKADLYYFSGPGTVQFGNAQTDSTIASITGSLGATTTISYKALTDSSVYTKDSDAIWPVRDIKQQGPMYVVSSVASSTASNLAATQTTNYFYWGAKAHVKGGGFLGFRQIRATEASNGVQAISTFRQTYPFRGLPLTVERKQNTGTSISKTTNTWTDNPAYNSKPYTFTTGVYHRSDLTQTVEESRELNGSLVVTVTTTTSYDAYGNASSVTVSTGDGYSKVTTNTYASPDTTNWFLGRLTQATVQSTKP